MNREEQVSKRFANETAEHVMEILHEDGLYRHVRFRNPKSGAYWYDLITWPGVLCINGDCSTFTFSRIKDMMKFFALDGGSINPQYWAEKLQTNAHREVSTTYDADLYRQRVIQWRDETVRWEFGIGDELTGTGTPQQVLDYIDMVAEDYGERDLENAVAFRTAVDEQLLDPWLPWGHSEAEAHRLLREFEHQGDGRRIRINDSWEWDLREYDWQFLWCCYAIAKGVAEYRAATAVEETA